MEKFAIDLDKVLDDFEFNEDCAEQRASVSPSVHASSSSAKCNFESAAPKTYNYHSTESAKSNKEFDTSSCSEKQKDSQRTTIENRCANETDATSEDFHYNKGESTTETADSVNHYYIHGCANDSKLTQKQTVPPYDAEPVSLTIYNDISQKLLQKQQNGSGSPKVDNRYDKKLNQPNTKPSISNVFNSLNEYINAPTASLDYVHSVLDEPELDPSVEIASTENEDEAAVKNKIVTHPQLVKNITKNDNTSITREETSNTVSTNDEASASDYHDDIQSVVKLSTNVADTATTTNEATCKYDDPSADLDAVSVVSSAKLEINQVKEDIDDTKKTLSQLGSTDAAFAAATQSEVTVEEIARGVEDTVNLVGENSKLNIGNLNSECKPLGFSNINNLSEEELTKYLAELEEEEKLNEKSNICQEVSTSNLHEIVSRNAIQSTLQHRRDDDTREAPIFENVTIRERLKISEEELNENTKKFPVIDYTEEQKNVAASGNSLKMQYPEEYRDVADGGYTEDCKLDEDKCRKIDNTSNVTTDTGNRELEISAVAEDNGSKRKDSCTTSQDKRVPDTKTAQDNEEYCAYNLSVDQRLLTSTKTETQLNVNEETFHSAQYNQACELQMQTENDCNCEKRHLTVHNNNDDYSDDSQSKPTETRLESNVDESNDESEKPTRPQTLDIVLTNNTEQHQMLAGSPSDTPSGQVQSDTEGMKDDCQGSSPDALDNSSLECNSILGKQPPFWVPDSDAPSCMLCDVKFTVIKRRHHCRACGKVLCSKCCSMKYKLEYQGNIDSRVCVPCYQLLTKAETEPCMGEWSSGYTGYTSNSDINSPQGRQPNPNNPMEYCSTIPPLQQLAGGLPTPPTVMVPVGVLKREGGNKNRPEGSKSVMFSDELDMSWDLKPPYRKSGSKRVPTPGSSLPSTAPKRQNLPRLDPNTESYIPQDPNVLPPTVTMHKGQVSYHTVMDEDLLYKTLKNDCEPPVMFAINRNLYAYVKITNLNCCVNKICWNITSRGLACVGQDEVILLIETLPDETRIPKDLLTFINQLYVEAIKGNTVSELGFSIYQGGKLLSSREHAGFLFIRQTLQCLQKIALPPSPFLVGLLVHRWETPWAKVFPLRLLLRLGAEYRYYPCPLVSVRFRDALYFEIGHTVMKVLADFRNFGYTLPGVRGLTIHLRNRMTDVMFPKNRYDQVIKGLNNSNDHVLAYASNFSISADSHLVCIQTNTGDESSYQTQAINIHNKPRTVTGASFIVINGALKSSMGLSAKSSIVEDGLMVEIMPEKMEALKAALKNMQDFSIGCGRQGAPEPDETVNIKWVDNDVQFNLGVKSPIDGQLMDGIPSIRVHNGTDYKGTSRFIRWTEVFIIKSDDHPNGVHDPVDINKLSGNIAKATCTALVKLLDLLAAAGLTKLGVRTTIHPDNVGYEAGSEGTKLPPIYMNSLDNELIQVLHKAAQSSQDTHTVLELIFYILDD